MKRKIEKIEDAEIIASKETKYDYQPVMEKVKKLRMQFTFVLALFFIVLVMIFGTLVYNEHNKTEEILTLQRKLKTLTPKLTFKFIENELDGRELEAQKKIIILIDQAVKNLEVNFVDKLNSVSAKVDNRKFSKLLEDKLLELQLQFDKKILELNKINNEKSEIFFNEGRGSAQVKNMIDNLDLRVQQKFDIFSKKLTQIEKEFLLSKNKILRVNTESFRELEDSFIKIAYSALKIEAQRNIVGSPWSKFVLTFKSLFLFRSTEPKEGNSLDSILSRAEYMLSIRNFEECLNELDNLDAASLELFSEWMKKTILLSDKIN